MGIPHLISTLEPFTVRGRLENEKVVIDGPALAYHILYVCRSNGIGLPSYGLLGQSTIAWLDQLTAHDVSV